jgi:HK97 gp10 family phage protein
MGIQVIGVQELQREFSRIAGIVPAVARPALRDAAKLIRDAARKEAPRGRKRDGSLSPGLLQRSIVSFLVKRKTQSQVAYVRVNVLSGRSKAPHGHLIEFGTSVRTWGGKLMRFRFKSKWKSARQIAGVKANAYFARAVRTTGNQALELVLSRVNSVLSQ